MKKFTEIAQTKRIEFIKSTLIKKNSSSIWHSIPITYEEANLQQAETSLTKSQILSIINSLTPFLNDLDRLRFRNLSNKSRDDLITILQEINEEIEKNNK